MLENRCRVENLHAGSTVLSPPVPPFLSPWFSNVHSQSGYWSSSIACTLAFAFRYATPYNGAPPGIEPASLVGVGSSLPGWGFGLEVEESVDVERGCDIPGFEDEVSDGGRSVDWEGLGVGG